MEVNFNTDFSFVLVDKDKNVLYLTRYDLERLDVNVKNIKKNKTLKELENTIKSFIKEK